MRGRPTKWVTAQLFEEIRIGKSGIDIVVWQKHGKRRGIARITVGGIRWYPGERMSKRRYRRLTWDELDAGS